MNITFKMKEISFVYGADKGKERPVKKPEEWLAAVVQEAHGLLWAILPQFVDDEDFKPSREFNIVDGSDIHILNGYEMVVILVRPDFSEFQLYRWKQVNWESGLVPRDLALLINEHNELDTGEEHWAREYFDHLFDARFKQIEESFLPEQQ